MIQLQNFTGTTKTENGKWKRNKDCKCEEKPGTLHFMYIAECVEHTQKDFTSTFILILSETSERMRLLPSFGRAWTLS